VSKNKSDEMAVLEFMFIELFNNKSEGTFIPIESKVLLLI